MGRLTGIAAGFGIIVLQPALTEFRLKPFNAKRCHVVPVGCTEDCRRVDVEGDP